MKRVVLSTLCGCAVVCSLNATVISYDETLYQSGGIADASKLNAVVDMTFLAGNILRIEIQNTSLAGALDGSGQNAAAMVSGIAFNLGSATILSGSITPLDTTGAKWKTTEQNKQWGYANDGTGGSLNHAMLTYNREASTMASDAPTRFDNSSGNSDGLNYGAVSANLTPPGDPYVVDKIRLDLSLSGIVDVNAIDAGNIAIIFGSANSSNRQVPDGGATLVLLGSALAGIGVFRRIKA